MKIAYGCLFVLLLTGCQSNSTLHTATDSKPGWVVSPERSGYISVVGYAPLPADSNEAAQYKVAMMKARQELAQMVRVRVQNKIEKTVVDDNGAVSSTANSATRLSSKAAIRMSDAQVAEQWIDPSNGGLYLLLELPQ